MGWWRGAERRREGPARDLLSPSARPAGSLAGAAMRKWALCAQTLSGGPGLRHLCAQSAGLPPGRSEPGSLCEADQVFWASLGEVPRGDGQGECLGQLGKGQRPRLLRVWGTHTHVLTISSALGVQGRCLRPRALLLVVLLKLFNRNETEQPLWVSLFI